MSANEDMFEPLALGERSAAAAPACNRKAPDWIPVPVPDGLPLPDGRNRHNGVPFPWHSLGKPSECFWFRNAKGEVLGGECRFDLVEQDGKPGKTYRPLAYCRGDDGKVFDWRWQGLRKPYPLFNLPRLIREPTKPALITEGARKALAATKLFPDFVPTAMLFGAKAPAKSDCTPLAARDNVIWPDHDDPGQEFVRKATAILKNVGAVSLRVVKVPPQFPPKWDLCDPLPDGVTIDDLLRLIEEAEPVALVSDPVDQRTADRVDDRIEPSQDLLADLVKRAGADVGVAFEDAVLHQLSDLGTRDPAAFIRLRAQLKTVSKVPLGELDKALAAVTPKTADAGGDDHPSQATLLVQLAIKAGAELFHNAVGDSFVTIQVGSHRETWAVRSRATRSWLTKLYFDFTDAAPNSEARQAALNVLEAKATFEGSELPVYLRVGEHDGRLYLDLCDRDWRVVEISPDGWNVISNPPIRFRRTAGMLPLPEPQRGGTIESLRRYLNVRDKTGDSEDDPRFVLAVAWLLAALHPRGPYPILGLSGAHGAAKSSFARVLRNLVDPNSTPLRSLPRDDRDLFIAAMNGRVVVFDNVSGLPDWLSDSLCRLSTGGGFATRQLYTDSDEVLFDGMRPIILNGIEDFIGRPDLGDRTIFLTLEEMPDERRRAETEFWAAFECERAHILGALLDGVAHGLKMLPQTKLPRLPRMADFATWVSACEGALWKPGSFMAAYDENRTVATESVLEGDAVATAVISLMSTQAKWDGTATDLLSAVNGVTADAVQREKKWPKDGRALSGRLRRATPGLRKIGINVERDREGKARTRRIMISRLAAGVENGGTSASAASAASAVASNIRDINDIRAGSRRTQTCGADAQDGKADAEYFVSYGPNPLENRGADNRDDADANFPSVSEPWQVDL